MQIEDDTTNSSPFQLSTYIYSLPLLYNTHPYNTNILISLQLDANHLGFAVELSPVRNTELHSDRRVNH